MEFCGIKIETIDGGHLRLSHDSNPKALAFLKSAFEYKDDYILHFVSNCESFEDCIVEPYQMTLEYIDSNVKENYEVSSILNTKTGIRWIFDNHCECVALSDELTIEGEAFLMLQP